MNTIIGHHNQSAVTALKSGERIVVIVGRSGIGKTHLAREYAREGDWLLDIVMDNVERGLADKIDNWPGRVVITMPKMPGLMGLPDRVVTRLAQGVIARIDEWPMSELARLGGLIAPNLDVQRLFPACKLPGDVIGACKAWLAGGADGLTAAMGQTLYQRRVSVDTIVQHVAESFDLLPADMLGKRRTKRVAQPRHIAIYLAKHLTDHTFEDIGRMFGGRDHSTVIHAVNKITALMLQDVAVRREVELLAAELQAS